MRIVLIGNYPPDKQESMERFLQMLRVGFAKANQNVEVWKPRRIFAFKKKSTNVGLNKWLGYLDKWVVYPCVLVFGVLKMSIKEKGVRYHICDHSNAMYLKFLPKKRTVITCHDVLAIRGAMGFQDAYCPATATGKILQEWILRNLSTARYIVCVSQFTLDQLKDLTKNRKTNEVIWKVIHNALNENFFCDKSEDNAYLGTIFSGNFNTSYILHVGSNLPRKNRRMLIEMVAYLGNRWDGLIVYAGQKPDNQLIKYAEKCGLQSRLVAVEKPLHEELVKLYSNCEAFIFPSFSEGFGWPIIEAQSCGVPVLTSNFQPFLEVSGGAAICCDPHQPDDFAEALMLLKNESIRSDLIEKGKKNASHFDTEDMINSYLQIHKVK